MTSMFSTGGLMMWPVLGAAVLVVVSAVRAWRGGLHTADAVLFWGGVAAVVGLIGTLGGIAQMSRVLAASGDVPGQLAWEGLGLTLGTTVAGLLVLLVALVTWYGLRRRARRSGVLPA